MSPVFGFMVALVLFTAVFSYVTFTAVETSKDAKASEAAELSSLANNLANLVVRSPGQGWYELQVPLCKQSDLETLWSPDEVGKSAGRFGLGAEPNNGHLIEANRLDYEKLINLRDARLEADGVNCLVDYEEARASVGFDEIGRDFHLRSFPVLRSVQEILRTGFKDPNLRPLYIGDYEKVSDGGDPIVRDVPKTSGVVDGTSSVTLWVDITNDGIEPTVFEVQFTIPLSQGLVDVTRHTPIIAQGGSYLVEVTLRKSLSWSWADPANRVVDFLITDIDGQVGGGEINLSAIDMAYDSNQRLLFDHADKLSFKLGASGKVNAKIYYESYKADGKPENHNGWRLRIVNSTDVTVAGPTTLPTNKASGSVSFEFNKAGTYRALLENSDGSQVYNLDVVNIVDDAIKPYSPSGYAAGEHEPQDSVPPEVGFIDLVIEKFRPHVFHSDYNHWRMTYEALPDPPPSDHPCPKHGDVFPDLKKVMNEQVVKCIIDDKGTPSPGDDEPTFEYYNVIIVGSNVDHQVMTSAAAKQAIRDWVFAGGLLVVFGSSDQAVQWLQPIFHSAIQTAGGGITVPDQNHPLLSIPNSLDYESFDNHDKVWSFSRDKDAEHFTHVITEGDDDILAISNPGEFGKGRVILTTYQAWDLYAGQDADCAASPPVDCQAIFLVHNFVTIAYQGLFVDYGPKLPHDRPHGSVIRVASVDHPELDTRVTMRLIIYVF